MRWDDAEYDALDEAGLCSCGSPLADHPKVVLRSKMSWHAQRGVQRQRAEDREQDPLWAGVSS